MSERIKENTRPNQKQKSRGIPVEDLIAPFESYTKGAAWLEKQVEKGLYKPVRASGSNGKHPPLYRRYLKQTPVTEERREKDLALKTELMTKILPPLSVSFYLNHLRQYEKDRQTVLALNAWLQKPENCSAPLLPCNERSFSIFQDEKLLQSEGLRIIGNLGLTEADFRFFSTMEPLGFFSSHSGVKQTILVCENLDTFVSVRNRLQQGDGQILGESIDTVIYGGGHRIERSIFDLQNSAQDYLLDASNTWLYWGDLDWEGLRIYEGFAARLEDLSPGLKLMPFEAGYRGMIEKGRKLSAYPKVRKVQKPVENSGFMIILPEHLQRDIRHLLEQGCYLPQEIVTLCDLAQTAESDNRE